MVYRLICAGTFEERVNDMMKRKRELIDLTVAAGENWLADLDAVRGRGRLNVQTDRERETACVLPCVLLCADMLFWTVLTSTDLTTHSRAG